MAEKDTHHGEEESVLLLEKAGVGWKERKRGEKDGKCLRVD